MVQAIREENVHHLIFVEGPNYSLASRWSVENPEPWITDVVDPPRIVYSPHVYFDYSEASLYEGPGESAGSLAGWEYYVRDRLMPAINWSLEHEVPLFIGEVGVPSATEWAAVMDYAFEHFFEPLQLSVAVWHYIDPQYNATEPMNLALPSGSILLDTLEQYPGGTTTDAGPFHYLPADSRIYRDYRVNPWHHDGSWGDVTADDSATEQVWAGEHSLAVVFGGNAGGLKFNHQYGLDTSVFGTFAFSLYPTRSDLDFTIFITAPKPYDAEPEDREPEYPPWDAGRPSLGSLHGPLLVGQWQQVELPLAHFVNPAQPVITGIAFQDDMRPDPVFYLDEISLILANQAPTDIRLDSTTILERTDGAVVGVVTISDPNPDDTHTLTVSDPRFEIVDNVLKLKSGHWLQFSGEPVVNLTITAEDSGGLRLTKPFVISIQAMTKWLPQRLDWLEQTYAVAPVAAAFAAADRIAVVWEGIDAGGPTVFMQLFTEEGVPVTAPLLVPQLDGGFREPAVALADDGSAWVAFVGQDARIPHRRFHRL